MLFLSEVFFFCQFALSTTHVVFIVSFLLRNTHFFYILLIHLYSCFIQYSECLPIVIHVFVLYQGALYLYSVTSSANKDLIVEQIS